MQPQTVLVQPQQQLGGQTGFTGFSGGGMPHGGLSPVMGAPQLPGFQQRSGLDLVSTQPNLQQPQPLVQTYVVGSAPLWKALRGQWLLAPTTMVVQQPQTFFQQQQPVMLPQQPTIPYQQSVSTRSLPTSLSFSPFSQQLPSMPTQPSTSSFPQQLPSMPTQPSTSSFSQQLPSMPTQPSTSSFPQQLPSLPTQPSTSKEPLPETMDSFSSFNLQPPRPSTTEEPILPDPNDDPRDLAKFSWYKTMRDQFPARLPEFFNADKLKRYAFWGNEHPSTSSRPTSPRNGQQPLDTPRVPSRDENGGFSLSDIIGGNPEDIPKELMNANLLRSEH